MRYGGIVGRSNPIAEFDSGDPGRSGTAAFRQCMPHGCLQGRCGREAMWGLARRFCP